MNEVLELFRKPWFWGAFAGWCVAQTIKMLTGLLRSHRIDFSYLLSTGGMPSAHSSMVSSLTTTIGMTDGFGTSTFAISLVFASITMFDAAGVRNAAGQQAKLLNMIVSELFRDHRFNTPRLKELLGHTRVEVLAGMLTGIAVAIALVRLFWPEMIS